MSAVRRPKNHASLMCDISDWQGGFDARAYARAGRVAVMIKAAEGTGAGGASRYAERVQAAHAAGLRVVHYQLLHAEDGRAQAEYLHGQSAQLFRRGDRLLADIEEPELPSARAVEISAAWLTQLEARGHTGLLAYLCASYGARRQLARLRFAGFIIADYGTWQLPNALDRMELGRRCLGRQFTDGVNGARPHTAAGITGPVDCTRLTSAGRRLIEA